MIDQITRQQFEDEVYLICGEDRQHPGSWWHLTRCAVNGACW